MTITQGLDAIKSTILDTTIFNVEFIIPTIIIFLTLLFISREISTWKTLALPISLGYLLIGMKTTFLFYVIAAILYALDTFALQTLTGGLQVIRNKFLTPEDSVLRKATYLAAPKKYKSIFKSNVKEPEVNKHIKTGPLINFHNLSLSEKDGKMEIIQKLDEEQQVLK